MEEKTRREGGIEKPLFVYSASYYEAYCSHVCGHVGKTVVHSSLSLYLHLLGSVS